MATAPTVENELNDAELKQDLDTVKVASIQAPSILMDTKANIASFTALIKEAAQNGAKFIVLPEAAITGYASQDFKHSWCIPIKDRMKHLDKKTFTAHDPEPYAEYKDGEMVQHFQRLCKQLQVYLTVSYVEKVDCPAVSVSQEHQNKFFPDYKCKFYNTITLINPAGEAVSHYRKTNLWPYYDYPWATPGKQLVTVDTEYGKVGLGVCYDVHKILDGYKELKIWTLLYCIAWVDDANSIWFSQELPMILKEKEIGYNIIGCNWSVPKRKEKYGWYGYGNSHLYTDNGRILASTNELYDNTIIYADVPVEKRQKSQK
mmetsp:Transcript_31113/g.50477  ORF Transcript_31113/g.50477 Transcript_31113/m.50477 type:complete len:317 (+) Transcript_31113:27-977(+)